MYQYQRDHLDVTRFLYGCVGVTEAEKPQPEVLPWPVMVNLEIDAGTILADDARAFGLLLLAAAEIADQANDEIASELQALAGDGAVGGVNPKGDLPCGAPDVESGAVSGEKGSGHP